MDPQAYTALAGITKYWYLLLIALILLSLCAVSVSEYRQRKRIKREADKFIGYLELCSDGTRLGMTRKNLIGSSSRADIIIEAAGIQKNHAEITFSDSRLLLRPISGETKINGRRAIREHEIFTGDMIELANVELKVVLRGEAQTDEA